MASTERQRTQLRCGGSQSDGNFILKAIAETVGLLFLEIPEGHTLAVFSDKTSRHRELEDFTSPVSPHGVLNEHPVPEVAPSVATGLRWGLGRAFELLPRTSASPSGARSPEFLSGV